MIPDQVVEAFVDPVSQISIKLINNILSTFIFRDLRKETINSTMAIFNLLLGKRINTVLMINVNKFHLLTPISTKMSDHKSSKA